MRGLIGLLSAGMLSVLAGCAGWKHPEFIAVKAPSLAAADTIFESAKPSLFGFDALEPAAIGPGDRVVLGLRIQRDGREQIRYVELIASDPLEHKQRYSMAMGKAGDQRTYESPVVVVHTRLLDENGELLREADAQLAADFVANGLVDMGWALKTDFAREAAGGPPHKLEAMPPPERATVEGGFCALMAFSSSVNNNAGGIYRGLVLDFLGARGLVQAILGLGSFSINVEKQIVPGCVSLPGIPGEMDALNLPLRVRIGWSEAMTCVLTVVEPRSPLTMTCGVVKAEIVRSGDPGNRVTMQVLSARRGQPK